MFVFDLSSQANDAVCEWTQLFHASVVLRQAVYNVQRSYEQRLKALPQRKTLRDEICLRRRRQAKRDNAQSLFAHYQRVGRLKSNERFVTDAIMLQSFRNRLKQNGVALISLRSAFCIA